MRKLIIPVVVKITSEYYSVIKMSQCKVGSTAL